MSARDDAAGVPDGFETRQESLDVYAGGGRGANEQRGGAVRAPGGTVAQEKFWDAKRAGKPVRGKNADRESHSAATKSERNGISFECMRSRDAGTFNSLTFAGLVG